METLVRILFLLIAFLVMGWAYWALSGGSDFRPETRAAAQPAPPDSPATAEPVMADAAPATPDPTVARADPVAESPAPVLPEPVASAPDLKLEPALDEIAAVEPTVAEVRPEVTAADEPAQAPAPLSAAEALAAIGSDLTAPSTQGTVEVASVNVGGNQRRVTADRVNVRQGPGVDFGVLGQVDAGDVTEVLEEDGGWVRVRIPDGAVGWMSARFLANQDG